MEYKQFAVAELKAEAGTRRVRGYGSVFGNVDGGGYIVLPGAFAKSLKGRKPAMLWQHRTDQVPGVWDVFEERDRGLYLEGLFAETPLGDEAYTLSGMGAITGLSVGFTTKKYTIDAKKGTRSLEEVELYEVSLVTFPMNEKARITGVKNSDGVPMSEREFEEYLRDVGRLSQKEAKIVVSEGYKAMLRHRDGGERNLSELITSLQHIRY